VERKAASACEKQAQAWLQTHGLAVEPITYKIYRKGWRFPARVEFEYVVFHALKP
jgi:hypothetical protein